MSFHSTLHTNQIITEEQEEHAKERGKEETREEEIVRSGRRIDDSRCCGTTGRETLGRKEKREEKEKEKETMAELNDGGGNTGAPAGGSGEKGEVVDVKAVLAAEPEIAEIVEKLMSVADKPPQTEVQLPFDDIMLVLNKARKVFQGESPLLEIEAPVTICGDVHGQYSDFLRILEIGKKPPETKYLFLGDYVDRAEQSIETVCLMFCYKILFPSQMNLLRGNHECSSINRICKLPTPLSYNFFFLHVEEREYRTVN